MLPNLLPLDTLSSIAAWSLAIFAISLALLGGKLLDPPVGYAIML